MHWVMLTASCAAALPCNTAELKYLPWGRHVALVWCTRRCSARIRLFTVTRAAWHRHSYMCLTQGSLTPNQRNHCDGRAWHNCSENLPTKLSRGCAGAGHLWLGYPGRSSGPRSQTAHRSQPRSRVSVGLEAPKVNQHQQQSGADLRQQCS